MDGAFRAALRAKHERDDLAFRHMYEKVRRLSIRHLHFRRSIKSSD